MKWGRWSKAKLSVSWSQSCPVRERISIFLKELFWFRLNIKLKMTRRFFFYARNARKCYEKVVALVAFFIPKLKSAMKK